MTIQTDGQYENEVLLRLDHVEKRFGRNASPVLGPVSMTVSAREIVGIRGANGAGKSTLLNLIAGVYAPDAGTITYGQGVKGSTGFVPQELTLYETLSGNENLTFYGISQGLGGRAIRVRRKWLLQELNLSDKAKVRVQSYSGGMKRRLHLATALMVTPRLLLLDEPTVGADEASAAAILKLIKHLTTLQCGIILVSHREGDLETVCDRVLVLREGCFS